MSDETKDQNPPEINVTDRRDSKDPARLRDDLDNLHADQRQMASEVNQVINELSQGIGAKVQIIEQYLHGIMNNLHIHGVRLGVLEDALFNPECYSYLREGIAGAIYDILTELGIEVPAERPADGGVDVMQRLADEYVLPRIHEAHRRAQEEMQKKQEEAEHAASNAEILDPSGQPVQNEGAKIVGLDGRPIQSVEPETIIEENEE